MYIYIYIKIKMKFVGTNVKEVTIMINFVCIIGVYNILP